MIKKNILKKIIRLGVYLIIFTPLLVFSATIYPALTGKVVIFRILIEILFIFWLFLIFFYKEYRPNLKSPLFLSIFIFISVSFISAFLGINPWQSFFSTADRLMGIFTWLHFFGLFLIISIFSKEEREKFLKLTLFVSFLVSLSAIYQRINPDFLSFGSSERLAGTIENPGFFASYLIPHIFLALYFVFQNYSASNISNFIFYIFYSQYFWLLLLESLMLFFTGTRGAILAFGFTLILLVFLFSFTRLSLVKSDFKNSFPKFFRRPASLILAVLILIFALGFLFRHQPFFYQIPFLKRFAGLSFNDPTIQTRFLTWKIAFKGWQERPFFGWGPENFNIPFNKYYDPSFLKYGFQETWFDRAHNIIFDNLIAAGLLGLISYLAIFFSAFYLIFKSKEFITQKLVLIAGLLAYFIQNLFIFDTFVGLLPLFLVFGFINTQSVSRPLLELSGKTGKILKLFIFFVVGALIFTALVVNFSTFKNAVSLRNAILAELKNNFNLSRNITKKNLSSFYPYKEETGLQFMAFIKQSFDKGLDRGEAIQDIKLAEDFFSLISSRHKKNSFLYFQYGNFLNSAANYDKAYLAKTDEVFNKALELSPRRQQIHHSLGVNKIMEGEYEEAIWIFKKSASFYNAAPDPHFYLGLAYFAMKDEKNGFVEIEKALEFGYTAKTPEEGLYLGDIYEKNINLQKALFFYESALSLDPQNKKIQAKVETIKNQLNNETSN
ncbi:MAG: O-antigen ligase family protein [Parcubacteria group bacterium]|nr:O-antigen ligase family protein [Parcubacteria group bacterium]